MLSLDAALLRALPLPRPATPQGLRLLEGGSECRDLSKKGETRDSPLKTRGSGSFAAQEEVEASSGTWRRKLQRLLGLVLRHISKAFDSKGQARLCEMLLDLVRHRKEIEPLLKSEHSQERLAAARRHTRHPKRGFSPLQLVKEIEGLLLEKRFSLAGGALAEAEVRQLFLAVQRVSLHPSVAAGNSGSGERGTRSFSNNAGQGQLASGTASFFEDEEATEETLEGVAVSLEVPVRPKVTSGRRGQGLT